MLWFGPSREKLLADPKLMGRWGEKKCERFLKSKGFKMIARNFSSRFGEIDLIMIENARTLVFVEVKTRRDESYITAKSAINRKKQKKMQLLANHFIKKYRIKDRPIRFDAVTIILR